MVLPVLKTAENGMVKPAKVRMSESGVGNDSNGSLVRTRLADWKSMIAKSIQNQEL